jgi:hypothetical protein
MRDVHLPKFGQPEDFTEFCDILRKNTKLDQASEVEISHMSTLVPRHMNKFMKPPIRALTILQRLSAKLYKYKKCVVEMKEILRAPMDHHRFPYASTCE